MAGFKTHITVSTAVGAGYAAGAYTLYDAPWESCVLAGGLCSVSGMLPDLDSEPGVPLREGVSFAAAVIPLLLIHRWQRFNLEPETMVLAGGLVYLLIRFGLGKLLGKLTVHRGMFHSLPALAIVGQLTYLICDHENPWLRVFFASAVMAGFASHLILDEIWSIDVRRLRVKSSFGTAVKLWGECWWANLLTYASVVGLALLITADPSPLPSTIRPPDEPEMIATQPDDRPF
ncbi:MAG: metal-dependent hydrolase [Planctomycetota bacterium]|nr:MAG: metal-dependent hydrolase [Planctomycetota bacterium]